MWRDMLTEAVGFACNAMPGDVFASWAGSVNVGGGGFVRCLAPAGQGTLRGAWGDVVCPCGAKALRRKRARFWGCRGRKWGFGAVCPSGRFLRARGDGEWGCTALYCGTLYTRPCRRGGRRALPAPAQGSRVDCQASATVSKKTSKGVRQPRRLRGLRLIRSRTRSNSACDTSRKLQPRGKKYRSSPLAFSLQPLCHGLCGSAKYTGALSCSSNSRNSANSDPLSRDKLFIGLSFSASTIAFLVSHACLE